jgi:hypothetical protein
MYNGTSGSQVGHNAAEERRGKIDGARGGHAGVSPVILGILLLTLALSAQGHIGISSKKTQELNSVQEMGRTAVEKERLARERGHSKIGTTQLPPGPRCPHAIRRGRRARQPRTLSDCRRKAIIRRQSPSSGLRWPSIRNNYEAAKQPRFGTGGRGKKKLDSAQVKYPEAKAMLAKWPATLGSR